MNDTNENQIESLEIYTIAVNLGNLVWNEVSEWKYFEQKSVGIQFVRAADSIGANIAEGYGRYFYRETLQFLYYARGSLQETKYWFRTAKERRLISQGKLNTIDDILEKLPAKLNGYIRHIRSLNSKTKSKS